MWPNHGEVRGSSPSANFEDIEVFIGLIELRLIFLKCILKNFLRKQNFLEIKIIFCKIQKSFFDDKAKQRIS